MPRKLVNVRLDTDRLKKAQRLRDRGIALSDVVREAIDARYAEASSPAGIDVRALAEQIFDQHPDPPRAKPRGYDVHDARAARAAVRRRLSRDPRA